MTSREKRLPKCPINIGCEENPCRNSGQCIDLSLSWEIPYLRTKEGLFVKQIVYRTRWQKQAHNSMVGNMPYCPLPSGDYATLWDGDYHEREMRNRIKQDLEEVGWSPAVEIPREILPVNYKDAEIPF